MRKHVVDRDILPAFQNRLLNEITADDLRALCNKVKARGAPATAVHVRDIVKQVYAFAILHGEKVDNPAAMWRPPRSRPSCRRPCAVAGRDPAGVPSVGVRRSGA